MHAAGGPSGRSWRRRALKLAVVGTLIAFVASLAVAFAVQPGGAKAANGATPHSVTPRGATPVPGAAESWGLNSSGQLGNGTTANQSLPAAVSLPKGVTISAIVGGSSHTLALAANGTLYAWGANNLGQLGNGTTSASTTPVLVHLPSSVTATAIAAGSTFSLALAANGTVYAWGANNLGQLGSGTTVPFSTLPVAVSLPSGTHASAIAAGGSDGLALAGGHVYAWGDNTDGALGDGTAGGFSATPVVVSLPAGTSATAIVAGGDHGLALSAAHTLYAWGSNQFGQLGNGSTVAFSATPVAVSVPAHVTVTTVADGGNHALAMDSTGAVYAWGDDRSGQLGNGVGDDDYDNPCNTTNDEAPNAFSSNVPVRSLLPSGVSATAIAAGACDSVALAADGTVYAWGDDTYGQLGNGVTKFFYTRPSMVHLPSGTHAAAVMAGDFHTALIQAELEGTAYPTTTTVLSGTNSSGQTFSLTIPPGAVVNPTTFTANEVALSSLPSLPPGVTLVGLPESFQAVDDITRDSVDHFGVSLLLQFSYPPSLGSLSRTASAGMGKGLSGGSSSSSGQLTLATTDGVSWQSIPSTTTPNCCIIEGSVDHFSVFAVWLIPSATSIEGLVQQFFASGDINNRGVEQSLLAKLRAAAAARAAGNCAAAGQIYQAFINEVRAQTGKHIDAKAANALIAAAQYLIANCP